MNILEHFCNTNIRNKYIICVAEESRIHEKDWYPSTTFYVCHNAAWMMDFLSSSFISHQCYVSVGVYGISWNGTKMYRFINCRTNTQEFKDFLNVEVLSLEDIDFEPIPLNEDNLIK